MLCGRINIELCTDVCWRSEWFLVVASRLSTILLYALGITITANATPVGSLAGLLGVPQVISMI